MRSDKTSIELKVTIDVFALDDFLEVVKGRAAIFENSLGLLFTKSHRHRASRFGPAPDHDGFVPLQDHVAPKDAMHLQWAGMDRNPSPEKDRQGSE